MRARASVDTGIMSRRDSLKDNIRNEGKGELQILIRGLLETEELTAGEIMDELCSGSHAITRTLHNLERKGDIHRVVRQSYRVDGKPRKIIYWRKKWDEEESSEIKEIIEVAEKYSV